MQQEDNEAMDFTDHLIEFIKYNELGIKMKDGSYAIEMQKLASVIHLILPYNTIIDLYSVYEDVCILSNSKAAFIMNGNDFTNTVIAAIGIAGYFYELMATPKSSVLDIELDDYNEDDYGTYLILFDGETATGAVLRNNYNLN